MSNLEGYPDNKMYISFCSVIYETLLRLTDHERYFLSKDRILDEFSYIVEVRNYFM